VMKKNHKVEPVEEGYQSKDVIQKWCVLNGLPEELKKNKASHRDKDSSPVPKLILFVQTFSAHDGTDTLILSTIFRQESQIEPPSWCYSAKQWFLPKLYKWDIVWETDYETTSTGLVTYSFLR
jgi:hypothetical protein